MVLSGPHQSVRPSVLFGRGGSVRPSAFETLPLFWAPDASSGLRDLSSAVELATRLGLPVEPSKVEGPSTTLTFLGIEIDTVSRELRLPRDKLLRLKGIIEEWRVKATKKSSVTKHQLDVLVGLLSDAAQVVPAGRPFIRQLIDAKSELKRASHFTRLSPGCKADIFWWSAFMEEWNGTGLFPTRTIGPVITADASGSWGCGAFLEGPCFWFQVQWPSEWSQVNIAAKELFPLVVAIAIWGPQCKDSQICLNSDNQAVVSALATRSAKDPFLSHLLRSLFFFLAHYNISYRAQHIAGKRNRAADALSRNKLNEFLSVFPQAPKSPSPIPGSLLSMLLDIKLQWTSTHWKELFRASLERV
uniref:RNase H type-1 domain-containing protein n=1 Tax=Amphimedon queenslandica TaxID=400682 RepID=A0A1X7SK10_AMPQE